MELDRVRSLIKQMKPPAKAALTGGGSRTPGSVRPRVESADFGDGVMPYAILDPTTLALGCSFSPEIVAAVSKARSLESAKAHAAVAGTVSAGLMTEPTRPDACDFFSEDALLAATLLKSYAEAGVLGYVFTDVLGQGRFVQRTVDARALNELYLFPLRKAGKKAAALQLDGGYLNGKEVATSREICDLYARYIQKNAPVITQYRVNGYGAAGVATNGAYQLGATSASKREIARAVSSGELSDSKLSKSIERTLAMAINTQEFYKGKYDQSVNAELIAGMHADTSVLLKNDDMLPIQGKSLTLFGDAKYFADGGKYALAPIAEAEKRMGKLNVFLLTDYEIEGISEETARIVSAVGERSKTAVVLCGACATPITFEKEVAAILFCPTCSRIAEIADLLTGLSPRGHLPFTWCETSSDYPRNNPKYSARGDFRYESMYNGYLLFNNYDYDVMFPFGHGLNYTHYDVSKFEVRADGSKIYANFIIKNAGNCEGVALCQLYITLMNAGVYGISKRLAAFKRVHLDRTENAEVEMEIDLKNFAVYDEKNTVFAVVGGRYKVEMGLSSRDIRANGTVRIGCIAPAVGASVKLAPTYYEKSGTLDPTAPEVETVLGVPYVSRLQEYPELDPAPVQKLKRLVKLAEKLAPRQMLNVVKYKIYNTPEVNSHE